MPRDATDPPHDGRDARSATPRLFLRSSEETEVEVETEIGAGTEAGAAAEAPPGSPPGSPDSLPPSSAVDDNVFVRDDPHRRGFRTRAPREEDESLHDSTYDTPRGPPRRRTARRSSAGSSHSGVYVRTNSLYSTCGPVPSAADGGPASPDACGDGACVHHRGSYRRSSSRRGSGRRGGSRRRHTLMSDGDLPTTYDQDGYALIADDAFQSAPNSDGDDDADRPSARLRRSRSRRRSSGRHPSRWRSSPGLDGLTPEERQELLSRPLPPLPANAPVQRRVYRHNPFDADTPPPLPVSRTKRRTVGPVPGAVDSEAATAVRPCGTWTATRSVTVTGRTSPDPWSRDERSEASSDRHPDTRGPKSKNRLRKLFSSDDLGRLNRFFTSARNELCRRHHTRRRRRSVSLDRDPDASRRGEDGMREDTVAAGDHPPSAPASLLPWRGALPPIPVETGAPPRALDDWEVIVQEEADPGAFPVPGLGPQADAARGGPTLPLGFQPIIVSPSDGEFLERCLYRPLRDWFRRLAEGPPILPWALESSFAAAPSPRAATMAGLTTPALTLLAMLNYYHLSTRRLARARVRVRRTFGTPTVSQLRERLARLMPEELGGDGHPAVALLGHMCLRGSQIRLCLRTLEELLPNAAAGPRERRRECRRRFREANPLMASAAYTHDGARQLYVQNLHALNRDDVDEREPLPLWSTAPQHASDELVLHDTMFCLSLSNLVHAWDTALQLTRLVLEMMWERMAETAYLAYLQLPALRESYLTFATDAARAAAPTRDSDEGDGMFPAARNLVRLLRRAHSSRLVFSPMYMSALVRSAALEAAGYSGHSLQIAARALAVPTIMSTEHAQLPARGIMARQLCLTHLEQPTPDTRPLPTTHVDATAAAVEMVTRAVELLSRVSEEEFPHVARRGDREHLDSGLG